MKYRVVARNDGSYLDVFTHDGVPSFADISRIDPQFADQCWSQGFDVYPLDNSKDSAR